MLAAFLQRPQAPDRPAHSVCVECKRRGTVCVMVAHGTPCLGPVTHAGCGALCPAYARGCYGCFGPQETPNTASLAARLAGLGMAERDVLRVFRTFNAAAPSVPAESGARADGTQVRRGMTHRHSTVTTDPARRLRWPASRARARCNVASATAQVSDVELRIFEPPRFFEAFLRGRACTEAPDITARICGICPVAYQMSACQAIEDACGVAVPRAARALRRLLYCGEWIESHALHIYLLHAPDFLGYDGAIDMAADHREVVERGLRAEEGRQRADDAGRRTVGPPGERPRRRLLPAAHRERARGAAASARRPLERRAGHGRAGVAGFEFPDLEQRHEYVALRAAARLPARARVAS